MGVGSKLKELRVLKGLTQEEPASRAELFKGFIFRLECDLTSSSITTLMDVLQCLDTIIGELSNETPDERIVFDKQDYLEKVDTDLNNEIKRIVPNAQKNMTESILLTLKAGGSIYPGNPHEGREFGYVLQESASIYIGSKTYKAKKGKSFYFTPDKKHYLASRNGALFLRMSSPPSF